MRLSLHTTFHQPTRPSTDCPLSASTTTTTTTTTSPTGRSPASSPLRSASRSQSPRRLSNVFRRPSLVLLRRRPSKVDMALSEERSRCDGDAIERQGLDLMEPRPVDPIIPIPIESVFSSVVGDRCSAGSQQSQMSSASRVSQPRFVMGGIFEVMEGRA
ncbi:hypothetical protein ANOM_004977 [Aspergillus terreus]|uniref:Uncharacterized protein n=1 Tax=Aspergillus terreus TaxID=33178 RepID=A0A5M3YRQ1_ASPTE|nr:hypothetical protein ATETN484_0003025000 [Aspergillus terreus]GFF14239.1 hypothetical protein ANOM_004977 [Aspergillus terreus]